MENFSLKIILASWLMLTSLLTSSQLLAPNVAFSVVSPDKPGQGISLFSSPKVKLSGGLEAGILEHWFLFLEAGLQSGKPKTENSIWPFFFGQTGLGARWSVRGQNSLGFRLATGFGSYSLDTRVYKDVVQKSYLGQTFSAELNYTFKKRLAIFGAFGIVKYNFGPKLLEETFYTKYLQYPELGIRFFP